MDLPFLRIPPFPGHRAGPLARAGSRELLDFAAAAELVELLRKEQVGGSTWGARPDLAEGCLLLAPCSPEQAREMVEIAQVEGQLDRCVMLEPMSGSRNRVARQMACLSGPVDPWHVVKAAAQIWAGADHELALVAVLAKRPVRLFGQGCFAGCDTGDDGLVRMIQLAVGQCAYHCPYDGTPISPAQAIALLGTWRRQIDLNREISAVLGVAGWKRPTVDPLLWDGNSGPRHMRALARPGDDKTCVAVWKARTPRAVLRQLEQSGIKQAEIEDGMIRGRGLGANCIPPLSVVVDLSGIYFDPSCTSDLELILEAADMDDQLLERAARLRERIVAAGISKYGGDATPKRKPTGKREVLVVGQVEDDRSILCGGDGQTNLELLVKTRSIEPDAWLIYRPHPDVEAGHRRGHIPDVCALRYANEGDRGGSISNLIESVDEVHCITSLAGFEALLRGKSVTTHGVPFYAGWGVTRDLGMIPARRTRRRSLDELVAATLILYPRYLDPVTRLPCPPEMLLERLESGMGSVTAPLAGVRMLQGKVKVALRRLWKAAA